MVVVVDHVEALNWFLIVHQRDVTKLLDHTKTKMLWITRFIIHLKLLYIQCIKWLGQTIYVEVPITQCWHIYYQTPWALNCIQEYTCACDLFTCSHGLLALGTCLNVVGGFTLLFRMLRKIYDTHYLFNKLVFLLNTLQSIN